MIISFRIIIFLLLATLLLNSTYAVADNKFRITDYHQTFFPRYNNNGELRIVIRMFHKNTVLYFLAVDPFTLSTEAKPATEFSVSPNAKKNSEHITLQELQATPYMRTLEKYTSPPYKSQNYGLTHAEQNVNGVFLTIDMCPTFKPFETHFFNTLISMAEHNHQPMPIALSITGLWIIHHPKEFAWLIKQEKENKLKITWINHSFSHVYYPDLPIKHNFLLSPYTNIPNEIMATEKLLLENDQLPSVFFRFPGLIANERIILLLREYGLIPIGSNAWLAKDQKAQSGSFILVHGNSNEPEGIIKLMPLLQDSHYHWLPLDHALIQPIQHE